MNGLASTESSINERLRELIALFHSPDASAAALLCDRRDPRMLAYRIVSEDLTVRDLSYGELRAESERFASALASLGVRPGDRVATLMGKSREYLVSLMGIWRVGAVHVPLFTAFAPSAIAYRLTGSNAKVVICDAKQQSKLAPGDDMPVNPPWLVVSTGPKLDGIHSFHDLMAASTANCDPAVLGGEAPFIHIFTSGTTGNPKGVVVPIKALALFRLYAELGLGLREDDLYWCAADPGWAYGLYHGILGVLTTGVPGLLFEGGFTPETTLKIIQEHGVTNFSAAPTVYRALRTSGIPTPAGLALRCASSCGEPLTPEVNDWAVTALGVAVHDHYGQTEAGCVINNHHHPLLAGPIKPGAMGRPMPGLQAVILLEDRDELAGIGEVGRVALDIQGSPLFWFGGYVGDAKKSAEKFGGSGRWYVTGDTGRMDEDGYFCFSARDDDVIIMAGYRIGPFEVESVIAAHPSVAECAVIAVPDQIRGEVLECYVVLRDGGCASESTVRDIQQWVKVRFAAHAYPRSVHFAQALPKTPSGKIQRYVLRANRLRDLQQASAVQ